MKVRSPILGYNHNVRYAGRLWHVQTEDSGVNNPHIFTHLFHDGTILATKRIDYDPANEVSAVQKLMQTQHKAMLRELKAGAFDEKIAKFFGEPVERREEESTDPNAQPPMMELDLPEQPIGELPPVPVAVSGERTERMEKEPPMPPVAAPSRPQITIAPPPSRTSIAADTRGVGRAATVPAQPSIASPPAPATRPNQPVPARHPPAAPRAPGIGARRPPSGQPPAYAVKPSAEGVVVARPAVIIGGESAPRVPQTRAPVHGSQAAHRPAPAQPAARPEPPPSAPEKAPPPSDNIFGGDLISEKSLDEVILAYLSEDLTEK